MQTGATMENTNNQAVSNPGTWKRVQSQLHVVHSIAKQSQHLLVLILQQVRKFLVVNFPVAISVCLLQYQRARLSCVLIG